MESDLNPLDKVWIRENNVIYPGIIIQNTEELFVVYKFDTIIWRRINIKKERLYKREDDFSKYMFDSRRRFMVYPMKFYLPN